MTHGLRQDQEGGRSGQGRSRAGVTDLSEILQSRRKVSSVTGGDAREKIRAKVGAVAATGIKSRLGSMVVGADRKRKLDQAETGERRAALAKRPSRIDPTQIINVLKENDKKTIKHETFIERKAKTGEAMVWDSKLSRPRMGMVADMKDSRVSAKDRLHQSGENSQSEEVIKRIIPNQPQKPVAVLKEGTRLSRNVVLTEVVEEDVPVRIKRTVLNDQQMEEDDDDGGFFQDRIVKTRDKFTEMKIEQQKTRRKKAEEYDLETDAGTDLPDLGEDRFVIEVRNNSPTPSRPSTREERPVLQARRSADGRKDKQIREVMMELRDMKQKENERLDTEMREKRREDMKKMESEKRKIRELAAQRLKEEKKIEELKKKHEELRLEQELKKKEESLKMEDEERKIAGNLTVLISS